jgi:hypothetical protein
MLFTTRQVAAVVAVFALSTGPALASATLSSTGAVKAKTALTAMIAWNVTRLQAVVKALHSLNWRAHLSAPFLWSQGG